MNAEPIEAGPSRSLGGFYSYKNTFDEDSVWLKIPKQSRSRLLLIIRLIAS